MDVSEAVSVWRFRRAVPEDSREIATVQVKSWRATYFDLLPESFLAGLQPDHREPFWRRFILHKADEQAVFVALSPQAGVVGFAAGGQENGSLVDVSGEIFSLYLLPDFQRRGIGRKLFQTTARFLWKRGHRRFAAWVLRDNPCRRFYQKMGGQPAGEKTVALGGKNLPAEAFSWSFLRISPDPDLSFLGSGDVVQNDRETPI